MGTTVAQFLWEEEYISKMHMPAIRFSLSGNRKNAAPFGKEKLDQAELDIWMGIFFLVSN